MTTEEAIKQIRPYLIGDLTPKEQAILEGHIDVDPTAQWYHQRYYRQFLPVLSQPEPELSEGVLDSLFKKAQAELEQGEVEVSPSLEFKRWYQKNWKIAAALLLSFGLTLGYFAIFRPASSMPQSLGLVHVVHHQTGKEERRLLRSDKPLVTGLGATYALHLGSGVRLQLGENTVARFNRPEDAPGSLVVLLERGNLLVEKQDVHEETRQDWLSGKQDFEEKGQPIESLTVWGGGNQDYLGAMNLQGGSVLAAFEYRGPVAKTKWKQGRLFLDYERQSLNQVLELAAGYNLEIQVPEQAVAHKLDNIFLDWQAQGLDRSGYLQALENFGLKLQASEEDPSLLFLEAIDWRGDMSKAFHASRFEVSVLEGSAEVKAADYKSHQLNGGQMLVYQVGSSFEPNFELIEDEPSRKVEDLVLNRYLHHQIAKREQQSPALIERVEQRSRALSSEKLMIQSFKRTMKGVWVKIDDDLKLLSFDKKVKNLLGIDGTLVFADQKGLLIKDEQGALHVVNLEMKP